MMSLSSLMSERSLLTPRLGLLTHDAELARRLSLVAYDYGFDLTLAEQMSSFAELASDAKPDLFLVDLSPDPAKDDACCDAILQCVKIAAVPAIALSRRTEPAHQLYALRTGALDYIHLPFSSRELATRVLRVLSRTKPDLFDRPLAHGDIMMDVSAGNVFRGGKYVPLKSGEFKLLHALMKRPQQVVSREQLLEAVFGNRPCAAVKTIDVYVLRLRQALNSPEPGSIIRTVRPIGYALDKDALVTSK